MPRASVASLTTSPIWAKGTPQKCSHRIAARFFALLGSSPYSLNKLLHQYPELPPFRQLQTWRDKHAWFAEGWRKAREAQGEFLAQKCLELAEDTTPKNAHAQRVRFDIYWKLASRFHPAVYGDKPATPQTNIAIGVTVSDERLKEIRSKLEITRTVMGKRTSKDNDKPKLNGDSPKTVGQLLSNQSRICQRSPQPNSSPAPRRIHSL